jgi:multidrug efflux pump subunit AcrB
VEVGSLVSPSTSGFVVANLHLVKAVFGVPDIAIRSVKLGDPQTITLEAVPGDFHGRVTAISLLADPKSRVSSVEVTLPNPVDNPVAVQISEQSDVSSVEEARDFLTLRSLARQVEDIIRSVPVATRVRNDWFQESSTVKLEIDPDRANLAGVTNLDVAKSSTAAMTGARVTVLREGDKEIPVVVRLRMHERAQLSDISNLYVYSSEGAQKVQRASGRGLLRPLAHDMAPPVEHNRSEWGKSRRCHAQV